MPVTLRQKENSSIFVARKGFLFLSKLHRARLKSQNPPNVVCSMCVCVCVRICSCMPAPGCSRSFSSLPLVTLPVALWASCQALLFSIHPSIPPSLPLKESALISSFQRRSCYGGCCVSSHLFPHRCGLQWSYTNSYTAESHGQSITFNNSKSIAYWCVHYSTQTLCTSCGFWTASRKKNFHKVT